MVSGVTQRQHAGNLAEAVVSESIAKLVSSNYVFGKSTTDRWETVVAGLNGKGTVTFNPSEFPGRYSTYNLDSDQAVPGASGRTVPARSVHFVARGRVGSVERWIECIYHKPPFPDGLIATGPVRASGLRLAGVRSDQGYSGGDPGGILPENRLPANMFSNALAGFNPGDPAVILGLNCRISGSVGSTGAVTVDPASVVEGEVLPGSEPRPVPDLDVPGRIAVLLPNAIPVSPSQPSNFQLNENWFNHCPNGLDVGGDLDLNGSALTVNGALTVRGSVTGTGIVLVDGPIQVLDGGGTVVSTDQVAIGAVGDVQLSASGWDGNYFKGLVYSEGNVTANDITVVGAMAVNGQNGRPGSVSLDNVRFLRSPGAVSIVLSAPRGVDLGNHAGAVSATLALQPDGVNYRCSLRGYISLAGDLDDRNLLDQPKQWPIVDSDPFGTHAWADIDIGAPGPTFGQALGMQLGQWMDQFEVNNGEAREDWGAYWSAELPNILNGMLVQSGGQYTVTFRLNNLLAEQIGSARVLLWRPFQP
jgi:hypothetical protein